MANHLLIGLGGTGGMALKSFRKQVIDKYRSLDIDEMRNVKTLWVDSSKQEMDEEWYYNGHNITLGNEEKLFIQGNGLAKAVKGEPIQPQYKGWIGKTDDWGYIAKNKSGQHAAGGQVRRLGRFNFAQFTKDFNERVSTAITALQTAEKTADKNDAAVSVHIATGLAGGTGSGSIIDVVAQIAKEYDDVKIYLYVVTPEKNPNKGFKGTFDGISFYHANGYAALKELNAYTSSQLLPFDLTNRTNETKVIDNGKTTNGIFVFSERSNNGEHLFTMPTLVGKIANILFLRAITVETVDPAAESSGDNIDELGRLFGRIAASENDFLDPENCWGLSNQFHVLGTQGLSVPQQRIKTYVSSEIITNAFNKILHNNFESKTGYLPNGSKENNAEKIFINVIQYNNYSALDEWNLSLDYLTLQKHMSGDPLGDWTKSNQDAKNEISSTTLQILTRLSNTKQSEGVAFSDKQLFRHIKSELSSYMNKRFRRNGYSAFYNFRKKDENITRYSKFITEHIRSKILGELSGKSISKSISLDYTIDFLLKVETEYREYLSNQFETLKNSKENKIKELQKELENMIGEFVGTYGIIPKPRKREKLINQFPERLKEYWTIQVELEGITFAVQLCSVLFTELTTLRNAFQSMLSKIEDLRDGYNKKIVDAKNYIIGNNNNATRSTFDCANSEGLDKFLYLTKESEDKYSDLISNVHNQILDFEQLLINGQENELTQKLETIAYKGTEDILSDENLKKILPFGDDFYNVHIVDLLNEKYGGQVNNTNLRNTIDSMSAFSSPMMKFENGVNTGIEKYAILPRYDKENKNRKEGSKFYNELKKSLADRGFKIQEGRFKNEIVFVQSARGIKLTEVERVSFLREKYNEIVNDPTHRNAKFLLHIQDALVAEDLKDPNYGEFIQRIFPYLWMLEVIDGFDKNDDKYAIIARDENGVVDLKESIFFGISNIKEILIKKDAGKIHNPSNYRLIIDYTAKHVDSDIHKELLIERTVAKIKELEANGKLGGDEWRLYQLAYTFILQYNNRLNKGDYGIFN